METQEPDQKIAERFRVRRSFVNKLVRQYELSGNYEPLPHGGGAQPKLTKAQIAGVSQLVEEDNDATLQQYAERLQKKRGIKVSISKMCRLCQKLGLTRKKRLFMA